MEEFSARKLGEVLAFAEVGIETFEKGREALEKVFGKDKVEEVLAKNKAHAEKIKNIANKEKPEEKGNKEI